jgi:hypothetical protein
VRSEGGGERQGVCGTKHLSARASELHVHSQTQSVQCAVGWMRWPLRIPYIFRYIQLWVYLPSRDPMIGDFESV